MPNSHLASEPDTTIALAGEGDSGLSAPDGWGGNSGPAAVPEGWNDHALHYACAADGTCEIHVFGSGAALLTFGELAAVAVRLARTRPANHLPI